jgi:hypothetical protein
MNEDDVRERARAVCDALVAGDVERVIADLSDELRRNLGEVLALLPLPAVEARVDAIDRGGSAYVVVIDLIGESEAVKVQTRWKERAGIPKIVEVSHLSRTARAAEAEGEAEPEAEAG